MNKKSIVISLIKLFLTTQLLCLKGWALANDVFECEMATKVEVGSSVTVCVPNDYYVYISGVGSKDIEFRKTFPSGLSFDTSIIMGVNDSDKVLRDYREDIDSADLSTHFTILNYEEGEKENGLEFIARTRKFESESFSQTLYSCLLYREDFFIEASGRENVCDYLMKNIELQEPFENPLLDDAEKIRLLWEEQKQLGSE